VRDLAMFNLAIDSKLRGCDLVNLRVRDVTHGSQILPRTSVVQRKTQRPVQFELTEPTRSAVSAWIDKAHLRSEQYLFPSRLAKSDHVSTRQYARIVQHWVAAAGLDPSAYGTHSMRRTKATLIYKRGRSSCSSAIPSWRARCATSASRSMTRWRSRSRRKSRQPLAVVAPKRLRPLTVRMHIACNRAFYGTNAAVAFKLQ
jgi:integrase